MSFLHLWPIYVGVGAAALPLAVHWLTRPRPARLPISTLRFVREVVNQRRARNRLRDFLVLLARTAAILLLAAAIARPIGGERALAERESAGSTSRVILLDVSQSMAAGSHGVQNFERARSRAAEYLAYRPGLRANLIQAGAGARGVFDSPSVNLSALHNELAASRVRPERLNLNAAISAAAAELAGTPADARRELVVVSDFQRSNWTGVDFSALPEDTHIEMESVALADAADNLAVLRVGCQGRAVAGQEVRLEVEVGNFSPNARPVEVEVTLGDSAYRLQGPCPAQSTTTLSQEIVLQSVGWQSGEARLVGVEDQLAADNVRSWVLEVRPPPTYALVTRQAPNEAGSSFYVERALAPVLRPDQPRQIRVVRLLPSAMDDESLAGAELIVLDRPGKLGAEALRRLSNLLRRGRALLYFAAEPVDAVNLQGLGDAAGTNLQMPVRFAPPTVGHARRNLFLASMRSDQSPFTVFGDELASAVGSLRFAGGLTSQRQDGALAEDLLASYSDQSAAIVITASGAGTLAVWKVDLEKSNLASSPAFVPLVGELTERLLGRARIRAAVFSGEPLATYLSPEAGSRAELTLSGPPGVSPAAIGELVDERLGVLWRTPHVGPPGIYKALRGGTTQFAVASEIPPEESDLRPLAPGLLKGRLSGGRPIHFHQDAPGTEEGGDWWTWLVVGCVACLLVELVLLRGSRA